MLGRLFSTATPHLILSRFNTIRRLIAAYYGVTRRPTYQRDISNTLFDDDHDIATIVAAVDEASFYDGFNLPGDTVKSLWEIVNTKQCRQKGEDFGFLYRDRSEIERRIGRPVTIAYYQVEHEEAVEKIATDPLVTAISERYLGYRPRTHKNYLWWNFASNVSTEERIRRGQTVYYHYDRYGFNFLYFSFYLTDVDDEAGPHVLMSGSHRAKPLRYLLSPLNKTDEQIYDVYGKNHEVTLRGDCGHGFIEDAFCYHKATPPVSKDRLLLQIRIS